MTRDITTIATGFSYLECPRWHEGRIWFVDFYTHRVLSADGRRQRPARRSRSPAPAFRASAGYRTGGCSWCRCATAGSCAANPTARWSPTPTSPSRPAATLNDMVVDASGRAFVGNFGFDLMGGAPIASTVLLRVDPDGSVTTVATDLWFPNGSVITDDNLLIVDETLGNRISAFDIGADGTLGERRTWAHVR